VALHNTVSFSFSSSFLFFSFAPKLVLSVLITSQSGTEPAACLGLAQNAV
jgi:hypothetical protein